MFRIRRRKASQKSRAQYLAHKENARSFIHQRVAYYNEIYGLAINRISIKNHRSLWGSCSEKGNLNFNYRLYLLPQHIADYVIVHEMCHLKEFNHSKDFWALVAHGVPDYRVAKKQISKIRFI